jgi:salicylate hydroxylase
MHVPTDGKPAQNSWARSQPLDEKFLKLDRFEPRYIYGSCPSTLLMLLNRIQKLVKLAQTMTPTGHTIYEPFDNWVHESGKVVLVGEAAHPLMVCMFSSYS